VSLYANQPGSVSGEKFHIQLLEKNLDAEIQSIEEYMQKRLERDSLFKVQEYGKLRAINQYTPYFKGKNKSAFESPDDINKFSHDLIRGMDDSQEFKLSKQKRDELLEIVTRANLNINENASFFNFGSKINDFINISNSSKTLYEELLDLSIIDGNNMRALFDEAIANSVIPFEKREIGVGLLSTNHLVELQNGINAWTTTFGVGDPSDIKKRGIRDIVLDRFATEAYQTMNQNRQILMAAVIDKQEMQEEFRAERNMGLDKIDQDMRSIEVLKETIGLAQKQIAYEGAFYAKLSDHLSKLAKTDAEDAALFTQIFYNTTIGDPKESDLSDIRKQSIEKWNKWFKTLSEKEKEHFSKYLSLENSLVDNPLIHNTYSFSDSFINNDKVFEKEAFIFKQYDTEVENLPDHPLLKNKELLRMVKAQKFYYEKVLRRIGLDFKYDLKFTEIPVTPGISMEAQKSLLQKTMLKENKFPIFYGNLIIGEFSWQTEDDPENKDTKRVKRLGNPKDGEKYVENYNNYLLFRLEERGKWAKRFYDIAEQLKRAAANIQALRIDGKSYAFDPISGSYLNNLIDSSLKSFDGGSFANINAYYQSLEAAKSLINSGLKPGDLKSIHEKLWKIETYRTYNEDPKAIMQARETELKSRKAGVDKEAKQTRKK